MYFDFHTFSRLAYLSFFKVRGTPSRLAGKRVVFLIVFFTLFPLFQLFNVICFLLDDILFPQYRNIEIRKPVFIVGNPRSGTTFIHRVMAKDEGHFFCFRSWEILFPAIIQKKALGFIGRLDRLAGGIFSNSIKRFESHRFDKLNRVHPTSLFYPEEDEKLLLHIASSFNLIWFFPYFTDLPRFDRFDESLDPEHRKRNMNFYKNCIKRQAYLKGKDRNLHLLSKNPLFSPAVDSLYEHFPDSRFIYMVRNPLEVIPSMLSLAYELWNQNLDLGLDYPYQDRVYETAIHYYNYTLARLEQARPSSYLLVNYDDLVRQPSRVIQAIYEAFGFEMTPAYSKILDQEDLKAKGYKSGHEYTLSQFEFTREQIVSDLSHIFERFGFSAGEEKEAL